MSEDNRQFHFRPANYPYRPTTEDLDPEQAAALRLSSASPLAPEPSGPQPASQGHASQGHATQEDGAREAGGMAQPDRPEPADVESDLLLPAKVAAKPAHSVPHGSLSAPAPAVPTTHPAPSGGAQPPSPDAAVAPTSGSTEQPVSTTGPRDARGAAPQDHREASRDARGAAPQDHREASGDAGSAGQDDHRQESGEAGSGGPAVLPPEVVGSRSSRGGRLLSRLLLGLLVLLALVVGLAVGSFALGNPTVVTTPGPTSTMTVTPPAQTVTAPPVTVTVTATPTATDSSSSATTTGVAVVGQSCETFGETAYSASGARLTCTRPTVQDYLRWMQLS